MKMEPRKFVVTDYTLEQLQTSRAMIIRNKIDAGEKLTMEDKVFITTKCNDIYRERGARVMGWFIPYHDVVKRYVIKQYDNWFETYACDKTSLRKYHGSGIQEILEAPEKP